MKVCKECGRKLPIDEFYRHVAMKDGHLNKCKECVKTRVGSHRKMNLDRIRKYDRERASRPNRKKHNTDNTKRWRQKHPDRYKAQVALNNAIRDGRVARKTRCEHCGRKTKLHGHHPDYSKIFEVIWLYAI